MTERASFPETLSVIADDENVGFECGFVHGELSQKTIEGLVQKVDIPVVEGSGLSEEL